MSETDEVMCFSYWTDPLCIWAYVAESKLDDLLANSELPLRVHHRIVPVFGDVQARFQTGSWRDDGPQGRARKTRAVAEQFGHGEVSGEFWLDDAPSSSWGPAAAIKAVFAAAKAQEARPDAGVEYQWRLREALFVDNRNTARRNVQLEVAEACRVPRRALETRLDDGTALAAVWRDFEEKNSLGVLGSPTYVFDSAREMLYGNVPLALIHSTVEILYADGAPGRSSC